MLNTLTYYRCQNMSDHKEAFKDQTFKFLKKHYPDHCKDWGELMWLLHFARNRVRQSNSVDHSEFLSTLRQTKPYLFDIALAALDHIDMAHLNASKDAPPESFKKDMSLKLTLLMLPEPVLSIPCPPRRKESKHSPKK